MITTPPPIPAYIQERMVRRDWTVIILAAATGFLIGVLL